MSDLIISDPQIADRLRAIAERENRSIEQMLAVLLNRFESIGKPPMDDSMTVPDEVPPERTLSAFAKVVREMGVETGQTDIVDRSREILNTEYADHLHARMKLEDEDTSGSTSD